jgi:predicted ester cyclase
MDDAKRAVASFVGAINAADDAALSDVLDDDFVDRTPAPWQRAGAEGFIGDKLAVLRAAFPDLVLTVEDELVEGDRIAWRWTLRATNTGSFAGMAPTGKPVAFQGLNIERLADGRITEHWSIHDSLDLLRQLGLFPEPDDRGSTGATSGDG